MIADESGPSFGSSEGEIGMEEITLFDCDGTAIAYVAPDDEHTIYLWSGKPVAYLDGEHIYGFNGKHLGWFEEGVMWDHTGAQAGFIIKTLPVFAKFEPFKAFKQFKPFKAFKEFAPFKPFKSAVISKTPLSAFLGRGSV
jgi:hypothetical protein